MAYEFLKKLFGTPKEGEQPKAMTAEELEAAIDGAKDIQVVDLKAGGYVSKDKFDAKVTELSGVRTQLNDANSQIQSFKDQDVDGIKAKVSEWETKYNTDTQALKDQLAQQARSHAEEMFLSGYKFTSTAAKKGVLAELRDKKFQLDENGTFLGAKEFMDSLMANEDYKGAFVIEDNGADGKDGKDGKDGNGTNGQQGANGQAGQSGNPAGGQQQNQQQPRFAAATNGGNAGQAGDQNPFLAAMHFNYVKQPPTPNNGGTATGAAHN